MKMRPLREAFSFVLVLALLTLIAHKAHADRDRLCGAEGRQWNEKEETVANVKAAQCSFTTRVNTHLCNGGASAPSSTARLWVGVNAADFSQAIRVGYFIGRPAGVGLRSNRTSYFYHFALPGACARSDYDVGAPAAGAQAYSITRVGNIWRVNCAGTNADSPANCATCDGVGVAYGGFVFQPETCCVGSSADTVQYTNCQRDTGGGMANPAGWTRHLTLPNYPVGARNPAAFVMQNEAANSFTIYDARN
jgi:hypothetical protein